MMLPAGCSWAPESFERAGGKPKTAAIDYLLLEQSYFLALDLQTSNLEPEALLRGRDVPIELFVELADR